MSASDHERAYKIEDPKVRFGPLLAISGRSAHRELRLLSLQLRTFGRPNAPTGTKRRRPMGWMAPAPGTEVPQWWLLSTAIKRS